MIIYITPLQPISLKSLLLVPSFTEVIHIAIRAMAKITLKESHKNCAPFCRSLITPGLQDVSSITMANMVMNFRSE